MQRYFIPPAQFFDTKIEIKGDDVHHLSKVMRAKIGDSLICSDGVDREALVKIVELQNDVVTAEIVEMLPMDHEPRMHIWIAQSLPKGDKLETVIQKCTELGASHFVPFISERTIVQYDAKKELKRLQRWEKIAKEAAEQAHRNRIPTVDAPKSWKQMLSLIKEVEIAFLCYEKEDSLQIKTALKKTLSKDMKTVNHPVLFLIGPEGGFSEKEVKEAEQQGCQTISLGKRILRTETAAMVALTSILYEIGELGGE